MSEGSIEPALVLLIVLLLLFLLQPNSKDNNLGISALEKASALKDRGHLDDLIAIIICSGDMQCKKMVSHCHFIYSLLIPTYY